VARQGREALQENVGAADFTPSPAPQVDRY